MVCPIVLALVALAGTVRAADRPIGEGPFGLAWGPMDRVDTPSIVDHAAKLTGLYYFHDRPLASGPDTVAVVLVACREQGLQQVVWVGRPLDETACATTREIVRREGGAATASRGPVASRDRWNGRRDKPCWQRARCRTSPVLDFQGLEEQRGRSQNSLT